MKILQCVIVAMRNIKLYLTSLALLALCSCGAATKDVDPPDTKEDGACTCEPGEINPETRGGPDWYCVGWCACKGDPASAMCNEFEQDYGPYDVE